MSQSLVGGIETDLLAQCRMHRPVTSKQHKLESEQTSKQRTKQPNKEPGNQTKNQANKQTNAI